MFKIQCELTDQKLRTSITSGLHKQTTVKIRIRDDDSSSESDLASEDAVTESFAGNSMTTTMDDLTSLNNNIYQRNDQASSSDQCGSGQTYRLQFNPFARNHSNQAVIAPLNQHNSDENAMDVSPKVFDASLLPNTKAADECVDQEMHSVKSDTDSLPIAPKQMLSCETCGANFRIKSQYKKHIKSHAKYRYQCSVCSRWFEKRYQLNVHHKTHNGVKSFKCSFCERCYISQTNLDRHVRVIHKKERQHTCSTCQKTFAQLASLHLHQSVHEAEREFGCDICKSKFKSEIHLKLHKRRHLVTEYRLKRKYSPPKKIYKSPPKLCICNECGKRFTSIALLRSHMQ